MVKNGSVGDSVIGTVPSGSGQFAMSSISVSCQKQSANATPNAIRETMSRDRNSSRCSTRVKRSS